MTNDETMCRGRQLHSSFSHRHSFVIRHLSFVIFHMKTLRVLLIYFLLALRVPHFRLALSLDGRDLSQARSRAFQ